MLFRSVKCQSLPYVVRPIRIWAMDPELISKVMREMGRKGGNIAVRIGEKVERVRAIL